MTGSGTRVRDAVVRISRPTRPESESHYNLLGVRLYGAGAYFHTVVSGDRLRAPVVHRVEEGDLLYNKMWASKGAFALVGAAHAGGVVTSEFPLFRAREGIDARYLRHVFGVPRFWSLAKAWSDGTTDRARLGPADFLVMPLDLLPTECQPAVATVLDVVQAHVQAADRLVTSLVRQKRDVMRSLLTQGTHDHQMVPLPCPWPLGRVADHVTQMPAGWRLVQLARFAKLESGHTPSRKHPEYWGGEVGWLSLADSAELRNLTVSQTVETITQAGLANSSARVLPAETVVLSRTAVLAQCSRLGRAMATSQDFAAFVCGEGLDPRYLVQLFRHMTREWDRLKAGTSPTNKTLYFDVFRGLRILLPPPDEQRTIADVGEAFDQRIAAERAYLERLRDLQRGLAQALLSGRVQLPPVMIDAMNHGGPDVR
jgi:type I restriction enzyme S subunit